MKKFLIRVLMVASLACGVNPLLAQVPFTRGVNLTSWFQTNNARQIQFSKFTRKDFQNIKSLGCDVIRLPINLHAMTNGQPDYVLDPLFLTFLDSAVQWAEDLQIHLLLDNHTFDPAANTDPNVGPILVKVWKQMAAHYENRSSYIYYEVLNEPHGIDDTVWGNIQQSVIDAIRTEDAQHYIIVGPASWNSYNNLHNLPVYADTKLIYTFHFYDPFIFTHQGASWTDPQLTPLAGVPFPYRATDMPSTPSSLVGTWVQSNINNYPNEGNVAFVKTLIDIAANFKAARNVPLFCGEFGVYIPNSPNADRVSWYDAVRKYMEQKGIPWTIWDYQGGFGLFKKNSNELFNYDLNTPLLTALGLTVPPQLPYYSGPDTTGFLVYDDFIGEHIVDASNPGNGTLDYYSPVDPKKGTYCAYWTNVPQYSNIVFDFKPNKDLSLLKGNGHTLDFWVKGSSSASSFDIRFVDSKASSTDHPWRMGKTITTTEGTFDDTWHKVSLRLDQLEEKGSYDNAYFPPEGKFDWKAVDLLEIVAEQMALTGVSFSFDDIRDTGIDLEAPPVTAVETEIQRSALTVFPNPVKDNVNIQVSLSKPGPVSVTLYTLLGQRVSNVSCDLLSEGTHRITLNAGELQSGVYLIEIRTQEQTTTRRLAVRK